MVCIAAGLTEEDSSVASLRLRLSALPLDAIPTASILSLRRF
ncbi:hypothetical protein GCM10012280_58570 [Wenjunlia tyrosinilytica]|uniref:Uncharacterized protein n=1 Tax=Wenjunlia tyrosinilytica TaxID=1544741 RepID=A0A917ZXH8_9ACTN|nr:hypothetical protein GCM10012280_58570 [Wenjunlia tyrosinilytica]